MKVPKLKIDSDFIDYYDGLASNEEQSVLYTRKYSDTLPKGKALAELRKLGVNTILAAPVRELAPSYKTLVVYTDTKKHKGEGKLIMSANEAMLTYPTSLASPYYTSEYNITSKFLQIGSRRFRVVLENVSPLKTGRVITLDEIQPSYNYLVGSPIFSIDYITTSYGLIATDFNLVQELQTLGIPNVLQPYEVINEIYNSLYKYNKA